MTGKPSETQGVGRGGGREAEAESGEKMVGEESKVPGTLKPSSWQHC